MSKRIVALVSRGMTDKTAVTAWEHEIPLLEAIHGEGAITPIEPADLADRVEAIVIHGTTQLVDPKNPRIKHVKDKAGNEQVEISGQLDGKPQTITMPIDRINAQELVARGLRLGAAFEGETAEEYDRLVRCYGMHNEVGVPVVEYVYGRLREGRFDAALRGKARLAA
ncbi:MAG: hypothetical protein IT531_00145 [Burkholderiales bacterium]|nr:hypothetical protein [Burkholderiales bacterium]